MNKRIKKKKIVSYNKYLCKRYPFLIPHNWRGKVPWEYPKSSYNYCHPYSYTMIDLFPEGWFRAFGKRMLEELRAAAIEDDFLDKFYISHIKEKYGTLRINISGGTEKIYDIIDKYEEMSAHYCELCGAPAEIRDISGWTVVWCDKCLEE